MVHELNRYNLERHEDCVAHMQKQSKEDFCFVPATQLPIGPFYCKGSTWITANWVFLMGYIWFLFNMDIYKKNLIKFARLQIDRFIVHDLHQLKEFFRTDL